MAGVEAQVALPRLCLAEAAVSGVRQPLPMQEALQDSEGLREQTQVSQHTHLQDAAVHCALDVTAHEGGEVLTQRQQGEYL